MSHQSCSDRPRGDVGEEPPAGGDEATADGDAFDEEHAHAIDPLAAGGGGEGDGWLVALGPEGEGEEDERGEEEERDGVDQGDAEDREEGDVEDGRAEVAEDAVGEAADLFGGVSGSARCRRSTPWGSPPCD
ncbi:MAG: hypothetical protein R3F65_03100 [bacterium]